MKVSIAIISRLYHGLISRAALDNLRAKAELIHGSGANDLYVRSAIRSVTDSFLYLRKQYSMLAKAPRSGSLSVPDAEKSPDACGWPAVLAHPAFREPQPLDAAADAKAF